MIDDSTQEAAASRRGFVLSRILVACSSMGIVIASYAYAPFAGVGPVLCPLHGLIGLPCPSCGLTRAFCRLARFDLWGALSYHALSLPLFAACLAAPALCAYELGRGRESWCSSILHSRRTAWAVAVLLAVNHAARLSVWLADGTLINEYVKTSWTYAVLHVVGAVGS
jgi:hypothetical protein